MWEQERDVLEKNRSDLARTSENIFVYIPEEVPSSSLKRQRCDWDFCDDPRFCVACSK
jgi:hypothetical protein